MSDIRRHPTRDFKIEAGRLVTEKGLSVEQAARNLGTDRSMQQRRKKPRDRTGIETQEAVEDPVAVPAADMRPRR